MKTGLLIIVGFVMAGYILPSYAELESVSYEFPKYISPSNESKPGSTDYFSNPDFEIYKIKEQRHEFFIPYSITNTKLYNLTIDCPSRVMVLDIEPTKTEGILTIVIPRLLLDSKYGYEDDSFFILVDGQEVEFSEIENNLEVRVMEIPFSKNSSQIEIIVTILISQSNDPLKISPCGAGGTEKSPFYQLLSPLKQFKSGIPVNQILCNKNLVLIQKYDNSPVCVKPFTAEKLIERGSHMNLHTLTHPQYSINTGTYSGFCTGYCSTSFTITPEQIIILKSGSTREASLLDQAIQVQFSEKDWNRIIDSIDFQKFITLPDKIGCPGCADAPVNWIEISDGNQTKKIEFENQDNIPEIKQLRAILEEITTTLNSKLDQSDNKIIPLDEKDKLIEIKKGEKFLVQLDSIYDWRIDIDNKTVVDSDYSDIRYSGSQAVYLAHNSGNATITGVGDPHCQYLEPPCMSPSILFQIGVRVE